MAPGAAHAPYIMPDGRSLSHHLKSDKESVVNGPTSRPRSTKRGKDLLFAHVLNAKAKLAAAAASGNGTDLAELSELRALEAVGVRRRRRWLNDRILREMTGPLTLEDMEKQFKPVPFGFRAPSALEVISKPQHQLLWEGFRNIDADREARVLQKWEEHNQQEAAAARASKCGAGASKGPSQEADALLRWSRVSRKARTALRKANLHSVLALESLVLQYLEECAVAEGGDAGSSQQPDPLVLGGLDAWGRLLVHGLSDYYGLASATRSAAGAAGLQVVMAPGDPGAGAGAQGTNEDQGVIIAIYPHSSQAAARHQSAPHPAITASDVVLAMVGLGEGALSAGELASYIRTHIHGSVSSCAHVTADASMRDEWVML